MFFGGLSEIRTRDLFNAIEARYQLRHEPLNRLSVPPEGIGPSSMA